jgi:hypothetical protein
MTCVHRKNMYVASFWRHLLDLLAQHSLKLLIKSDMVSSVQLNLGIYMHSICKIKYTMSMNIHVYEFYTNNV